MKLVRLITKTLDCGSRTARAHLAAGRVRVNGEIETSHARQLEPFDHVQVDHTILQARIPRYVALHKPSGHVSATTDPEHPTVIDLIDEPWADDLHLAGRLDRFTTGLVILTNDSQFSESLTLPQEKIPKVYHVKTDLPISAEAIAAFKKGMRFEKENATTAPAQIKITTPTSCRLTIYEGKHHQVKRMFARFGIKVTALHRESVGNIALGTLKSGEWHEFTVTSASRR
jgi:16S rRNA pseudouridine516 synthase